ncbi:MAG TPA: serine hydrolase domain-containing protein [Puia sp.]|nr:serine hydrolase domain-containing protein [Puia sp.]
MPIPRCLFLVLGLATGLFGFGQPTPKESRAIQAFTKDLADEVRKDDLHGGISMAVVRKDQLIWAGAVGYSNMSKDVQADTGTIYRICSITKMFTVTVLLQLVEEGKVRLDDPAEKYIPEVGSIPGYSSETRFTLQQLASHTSGLNREPNLPGASAGPTDQWESKVLACIPHASFNGRPGDQFLYSNIGFALLGLALERASGTPFIQLVRQRIFDPLGMNNTFFAVPDDKRGRLAQGMDNQKGGVNTELPLRTIDGMGYRVPNGGIWSTPSDLGRFVMALMSGRLLKPASIREMLTVPAGSKNYGMGTMIMHDRQLGMFGHDGGDPGYTSMLTIEPASGYAVIFLRNYNIGVTNLRAASWELIERL